MMSSSKDGNAEGAQQPARKLKVPDFFARNPSNGITVKEAVPITAEQIYGCSFWLINYHLPRGGAIVFAPGRARNVGRLVKDMANLRQDRVPEPTLSGTSVPAGEGSALNGRAASTQAMALFIRLQSSDRGGQAAAVSSAGDWSAMALAIDVVTASGGAPDPPQDAVLTARFSNLQSALLAARRFHWALEGMAESAGFSLTASTIIYSADDPLSHSAATALERAAPGRILIANRLAEAVQQMPGFSVGRDGENWRELEWRVPAQPGSFAADEQSVLGLIHALGRQDPLVTAAPGPTSAPVSAPVAATDSRPAPMGLGRSFQEPDEPQPPIWKKPWVAVSAGAVVLIIVAVFVIRAMTPGSRPEVQAPVSTAPPASSPAQSASTPAPAPEKPAASKLPEKSGRAPRTQPHSEPRPETQTAQTEPPKPPPVGSCDLTETEIPLSLQRAARLMSAGKLIEAQDAYQRLAGCPSARDKALEGLRQVKQRMGFQGNPN